MSSLRAAASVRHTSTLKRWNAGSCTNHDDVTVSQLTKGAAAVQDIKALRRMPEDHHPSFTSTAAVDCQRGRWVWQGPSASHDLVRPLHTHTTQPAATRRQRSRISFQLSLQPQHTPASNGPHLDGALPDEAAAVGPFGRVRGAASFVLVILRRPVYPPQHQLAVPLLALRTCNRWDMRSEAASRNMCEILAAQRSCRLVSPPQHQLAVPLRAVRACGGWSQADLGAE